MGRRPTLLFSSLTGDTSLRIWIAPSSCFRTFCSPSVVRDCAKNCLPDAFTLKETSTSSSSPECNSSARALVRKVSPDRSPQEQNGTPRTSVWGPPPPPPTLSFPLAICWPLVMHAELGVRGLLCVLGVSDRFSVGLYAVRTPAVWAASRIVGAGGPSRSTFMQNGMSHAEMGLQCEATRVRMFTECAYDLLMRLQSAALRSGGSSASMAKCDRGVPLKRPEAQPAENKLPCSPGTHQPVI